MMKILKDYFRKNTKDFILSFFLIITIILIYWFSFWAVSNL